MILLGNPENRRVSLFRQAFESTRAGELEIVPWTDFLRDPAALSSRLRPDYWLRIESPGENFAVEKALLALGAERSEPGIHHLPRETVAELAFEQGRILPLRQWYLGWQAALERVRDCLAAVPGCSVMNAPQQIATLFDKAACHARFAETGVPTPRLLGTPANYPELRDIMAAHGCRRVFLKPCHGSSASGVVALEISRTGPCAYTSVEVVRRNGHLMLFNSLKMRRYQTAEEIAELVDAICRERCIAEAWFPKAGFDGQRFDLRVLVIDGKPAHAVVRQSAGPITNLHLGNRRGNLDALRQAMGEDKWSDAMAVCAKAAAAFPGCLYVAIDLLVSPGFHRFAVAEANAFGDLLPNLEYAGMDTYAAEIRALQHRDAAFNSPRIP